MLYKFKSKSGGDVIMTAPVGDAVLRVLGREPATQGIFEAGDLPQLIGALEAAVSADEARRQSSASDTTSGGSGEAVTPKPEGISLKQRSWPLLELMKRAGGAGHDVVWGV